MSVDNSAHIKTANLKGLALKDFFKGAYALTHSECCVCSRPLRDAESVETGIGPICRKNYGYTNAPASNVDLAEALKTLTLARLDMDVFKYVIANKDSVRMMNNILIAYCTYLMGKRRGAEIVNVTPAIRTFGYPLLADKLEKDRTKHKFLTIGLTSDLFFRTENNSIVADMSKYLSLTPEKVKGFVGKGFVLKTDEHKEVAEWLCAKHAPRDLVFLSGGAAILDINTMTEPAVIANYVEPIDKSKYAYVIEHCTILGASVFTYPYPCPKVYGGMRKYAGIVPTNVVGHRYKVTVLDTPDKVALAMWLVAGEIGGTASMYVNGVDVPLAPQSSMAVPNLIANPPKKTPVEIDFKVWYSSTRSINVATPVPWDHSWVKPLQGALKGIGAKFDKATMSWRLPKAKENEIWALISSHSPYCKNEFPPLA